MRKRCCSTTRGISRAVPDQITRAQARQALSVDAQIRAVYDEERRRRGKGGQKRPLVVVR